ncbi:hypothetical protein MYSTI_06432 [Myxococcus stipitatus DSM 14675]|uniref:Uncharacterized protein n=1 Tax=Myxococcus stipitatus (strain DSM 14675 / JCM 12634 / Mx s8) TaxID=1278073 RepID=L7UIJ0_MYXSD|nr:hypothetical protein [Myxococcus stipitatus]AGC47705.1 hypothetical protein MYSTI_06432 [Myxococcus stipitatus DSM 14675]
MHGPGFPMGRWSIRHAMVWALVVLFAPGPRAQAYPISPETLWSLTLEAEWVVWADVEDVRGLSKEEQAEVKRGDWETGAVTRLRIREAWKGAGRPGEQVDVHWFPSMCPAPPSYEEGHVVVAFLTRRAGKWRTVALSYGTRYPASPDDTEAYRRAVTLAKSAQDQWTQARIVGRRTDLEAARVDWHVRVSTHPATRWDGLYGLVPDSDAARSFYDRNARNPAQLTRPQLETLAHGFVEQPPLDHALPMMLTALRGHVDTQVDLSAARALETVFSQGEPKGWVIHAFDLLRERQGEAPLEHESLTAEAQWKRRIDDWSLAGSKLEGKELEELTREWARFKQRHQLTPALLPLPAPAPVPGTGGDTTL